MITPTRARAVLLALAAALPAAAQPTAAPNPETSRPPRAPASARKAAVAEALSRAAEFIVERQEGDDRAEWPYEGVYRVNGQIPVGYRIGGTAIAALALMADPSLNDHQDARAAVDRALIFIARGPSEPLMSWQDYDAGYDVRGWGYTYGLLALLRAKQLSLIPDNHRDTAESAIRFYLDGIKNTEIPQAGGWNYARPPGRDRVAPPSPFMTAPTLQALFEAKRAGYDVDPDLVGRALDYLEASRAPSGAVVYSGDARNKRDGVPGAVGRMLATESVLLLAGRGSPADVRAALDAFIVHWDWLEQRRAKPRTHVAPYGVAPYYFYFAHYYAALAVELLPEHERAEYRRHVHDLIFKTRADDGSWNDRVFPRSAAYSTAMVALALRMPDLEPPARWPAE